MFDNIRGVIFFQIIAAKPEEIINRIKFSKMPSHNLRVQNGVLYGSTYRKFYADLEGIVRSQNAEMSILKKKGFIFNFLQYKKRIGFAIGSLLAFTFVLYMSNIALKIDIEGNNKITSSQILALLKENGIDYGEFIPNMDFRHAERSILTSTKQISWVGIRKTGGRIVVEIDEMVQSPEVVPFHVPCNVVSLQDAQVINAEVYNGTLVPKLGDGVQKGDILISGVTVNKFGRSSILHAYGSVTGRYTEKMVFTQDFKEEKNLLTGQEIHRRKFQFFGLKIPLNIGKQPTGEFEYEESTNYFSFFNMSLPIGFTFETFRPFAKQQKTYTPEEAEASVHQKKLDYEEVFLKDKVIISAEEQYDLSQNQASLVILYTLEGEIGTTQEILAKK